MAQFVRTNGKNNPKTSNPEYLSPFEYSVTSRRTRKISECCQGQWYKRKYWRTWQVVSDSGKQKGDVTNIGEEWDMLMEQLKALQQSFNEDRIKAEKDAETIQVLQKYLKLMKSARTPANN